MKRNARDHKEPGAPAATHCTACNAPIYFKRSTPYRHAILDVLVCKKCRDFYGNGEWTRDENGQDEYCRWCAEGGVLYICCNDDCLSGFCRKCIKRNFDATECEDVENDDDWRCYICNPKKLKALQKEAKSVLEKLEEERRREKLEEEENQVEDRSNEVSKQNGAHSPSPQSTFKDLLDALREASSTESSGPSLRDQAKVRTVWHNLKPRLLSLGKAIKGSDFSEAAELVGGFIDSAPLPRSLPRPPSPAFSRPSASPQPSRSPSPRSSRSASSPPDNSARASSPSSPLDNSARAPSPSPPPRTQSPPRPGSHASSASPSARAPPKPGAFTTSTPTPSSKRTLAILDPPFPPQSPIAEVPEGDESPPETSAVPRERVQQSVEAALQKLVEVSRGTAQNVSSTSPSGDSPFRDSEDESEKSESPPSRRRAKKSDSNAKTVPCVGEKVKVKSEPPDEDQTSPDPIAGVPESEHDVVGERNVEAGPSQAPPIRTERLSPSDDDRIIWGNLTIRDFVANRLEVRVERLETLLDKEDAPKAITTGSQDSDEEEAYVDDPELLKLLKDPLRRRRLRRNIRHAVAKRKPVLKSSPEKGSKQRKVPESDSGDDDSDVSCASHDASDDSLRPSMSNALVLGRSSNEDEIMPSQPGSDSDDDIQIIGEQKAPRRKKAKKEVVSSDSEGDAKTVARNGVEDDDSDEDRAPIKRRAIPAIVNDEPSTSKRRRAQKNCDSDESLAKRRKTKRRKVRIIDSDEEEAGSDEKMAELSPLVSDSGSELEEPERPKRKKKSKKKKNAVEGSDSEQGEDESGEKKKERSMRKIISDDKVEKESRAAAKEEAERRKRVLERQKLYNEIEAEMQKERKTDKVTRCVLEYDPTSKEPMVEVDEALVRSMKPHQVDGVKFLYNTLIESVEHVVKGKPGGGAILAHCMGLGKTFQTICLLHTLLTHKVLSQHIKRIIVVCPCNVVLNWAREFEMWVEENMDVKGDIPVYEFSRVKNVPDRMYLLEDWYKSGGVLIIGYSMFRLMSQNKTKSRKVKDRLPKLLHDPGADVVVCDEGHMLKSGKAQISQAMNLIKTQRRLILTGTPLQNNMSEYHCMVSFVKPNLLGTPKEFSNRFMNPITYGQEANASSYAVRLMKKRVHILNKLLAGCVHRCDYSHLTPYLPTKFEYIISIELSELQKKLYREYLKHIGVTEETTREDLRCRSLLKDYQTLKMVWSHPYLLMQSEDRQEDRRQKEAYKNQMDEFVVEGSEEDSDVSQSGSGTSENGDGSDKEEVVKTYKTRRNRRENPEVESEPEEDIAKKKYDKTWWVSHVPEDEDDFISLGLSSKLSMAFQILRECELIGDKVILFSTSLLTLSLFERNLHIEYQKTSSETAEGDYINSWVHGLDYFRLDGSTSVDARKRYIDHFNDPNNLRARLFLVSTKAGGIGTNMIGANRIIVLDASWNPSDDTQAIFRAFRYGQVKPVYVYRLLAHATMEEKIYDRQVNKISLASRVVDEQNLERHFNESDLKALYEFKPEKDARKTPAVPKDRLLAELLMTQKTLIQGYHEHDSLLQKELEDELTEEERKQAWKEYEDERDGKAPPQMPYQMPGPYGNIPGFTGTMPGYTGTLPGGIPGGLPGGIPGMPNFPGGIHRMPGFGIPGTSGANQWTAQMAQQFMAQLAARARLPNNASYAAHQNQFMPRAAQRPAGNMNFQQRPPTNPSFLPRQGNIPNPTTEEILSRPPHFDANLNHPTLNPKKMLEDIKLKYPNDHQVSIAARWRSALKTARDKYAASLTRLKQTIEVHQKLGRALPLDAFRTQEECESAVKICDHLVIGLENSYQRFRQDVATEQRKAASSSRPTVIDLDSPSTKNTTGRTGPIIEEIE